MKKSNLWLIIFLAVLAVVIVAYNLLPQSNLSPLTVSSPIDCSLGLVAAPTGNPSPPSYLAPGQQFWTPPPFGLHASPPSATDCLVSAKVTMDSYIGPLPLGQGGGAINPQNIVNTVNVANVGSPNVYEQFERTTMANNVVTGYDFLTSDRLPDGLFDLYDNQAPVNSPITTNAVQQNRENPYPFVIALQCLDTPTPDLLAQNPNAQMMGVSHAVLALGPEIFPNPASPSGMSFTGSIVCSDPQHPTGYRIITPKGRGQTINGEREIIEVPSLHPLQPGYTRQCWVERVITKG